MNSTTAMQLRVALNLARADLATTETRRDLDAVLERATRYREFLLNKPQTPQKGHSVPAQSAYMRQPDQPTANADVLGDAADIADLEYRRVKDAGGYPAAYWKLIAVILEDAKSQMELDDSERHQHHLYRLLSTAGNTADRSCRSNPALPPAVFPRRTS